MRFKKIHLVEFMQGTAVVRLNTVELEREFQEFASKYGVKWSDGSLLNGWDRARAGGCFPVVYYLVSVGTHRRCVYGGVNGFIEANRPTTTYVFKGFKKNQQTPLQD